MTRKVRVPSGVAGFAEDKDEARQLRTQRIIPALEAGDSLLLDFSNVSYATQSFVHALLGEPLKRYGEGLLGRVEFRNCTEQLRSVIELVVDYSLGGFPDQPTADV
jgi:hypothetical protein